MIFFATGGRHTWGERVGVAAVSSSTLAAPAAVMSVVVSPASVIAPALELTLTAAALLLVVLKPVSAMFPGALIVIVPEPALIVVPAFIAIAPTASRTPLIASTVTLPDADFS